MSDDELYDLCQSCRLSASFFARNCICFRAEECSFDGNRMKIFDPNHAGPCGKIGTLVVEVFGGIVVAERCAPRGYDHRRASAEHSNQTSLIERKENVLMRDNLNQMLQAIWNTEVPHRHTEYNNICAKKAISQFLDLPPYILLFGGESFPLYSSIFCVKCRPVERQKIGLPYIQCVDVPLRIFAPPCINECVGDLDRSG